MDADAAERLVVKLQEFVAALDAAERALFASLLAPGVAAAYAHNSDDGDVEVEGFVSRPLPPLAAALAAAVRRARLRIVTDEE